ncbi:MAG: hypothetical protein HY093_03375, partial [Candidatus Liptonbacteria bacterium]|nr:hypothetical protein [Candidatus Liptonbacteria bacterium]
MSKDEFVLTVGQAQKLEFALRRNRYDPALVKVMTKGDNLGLFRDVLLGQAEIKPIEHLIDCDADPFVPKGWEVVEHHKGGRLKWDTRKVKLYLSKR